MPDHPSQAPGVIRRSFVHCVDTAIAALGPRRGDTVMLSDGGGVVDSAHGLKLTVGVVDGAFS